MRIRVRLLLYESSYSGTTLNAATVGTKRKGGGPRSQLEQQLSREGVYIEVLGGIGRKPRFEGVN